MRISGLALVACFALVSLPSAQESLAAPVKQPTTIPAEELGTALQDLAKARDFQVIARADLVKGIRSQAVSGDYTPYEALAQLLSGTGLTYQPLDARTVTIVPVAASTASGGPAEGEHADADKKSTRGGSLPLAEANPSDGGGQGNQSQISSADQTVRSSKASSEQSSGQGGGGQGGEQSVEPYRVNTPEVLIVGSRVMNVDVKRTEDDAQPYYILDSKQIEQSGATNIEDFLKERLTMDTNYQSTKQDFAENNVYGTRSRINLRGLGTNETLILIDGRRIAGVSYNGNPVQPDINGIPTSAVERIEVLPTSASAIYGGSALGGVVNIVLKKNFQGGEVSGIYENTTGAHAPIRTLDATYGLSLADGKTNVMLSGHYSDAQPLVIGDRLDLVQRGISNISRNSPSFLYNAANPFAGATPNIACRDASGNATNCVLRNGTPLNSSITFIPAGAAPGSDLSAALLSNAGTYNLSLPAAGTGGYGLQNPIGLANLVKSLMATIRQEFTSSLEGFTEFSTRSNSSHTPSNPFQGSFTVPSSAPDNPFQQDVSINFPSTISAPVTSNLVTQSVTAGLLTHLPGHWNSEVDYTWSRNSATRVRYVYDFTGINADLASGVLNPFVDTIAHPLNLAPYLAPDIFAGPATLNDLGLRASGPVGSFPWGRPTLTIGLEHRKEGTADHNDYTIYPLNPANTVHDIFFGQSQSTDSIYAEAQIPLITAKNSLPGIRSLDVQLAGRSEKYRVFAQTSYEFLSPDFYQPFNPPQGVHTTIRYSSTNPTVGLKYKPVEDLIFRASYARAFLPPTADQFLPNPAPQCGFPCVTITDPKNGQTYDVDFSFGGNPNLQPQTSRSWNFGLIFEPQEQALQGLRVDLEYYRITQPNYITNPSNQQAAEMPNRVTRDPVTGLITLLDESPLNAIVYKTNGWDLTLDYRKATTVGVFGLHASGTVVEHDQRQYEIGSPSLEFVGYPYDEGEAKTKANATVSWEHRQWTLGWTATYVSSYTQIGVPSDPQYIQFPGLGSNVAAAQGNPTIPSQTYHTLFGSYRFEDTHKPLAHTTIAFGIKNVFNALPPFDVAYGPYYYSQYGDPRLRDYWVSVKKGF